jgi:1,4-dihydroxy-2-naphthoate octaprenyltransferase
MKQLTEWLIALRALYLTATIVPFLAGGALTYHLEGSLDYFLFVFTGIGLIALHLGTNMANDYFDDKYEADKENIYASGFSGGSGAKISPQSFLISFISFFAFGFLIGVFLFLKTGFAGIPVLGLFGLISGYVYTAGPIKLSYRGLGEICIGLNLGPLIAAGTYLVQTGAFSWYVFLASLPTGLLMIAMIVLNEFPDKESDKRAGKNNIVVRIGRKKAAKLLHAILIFVMAYTIAGYLTGHFPAWILITSISFPLAFYVIVVSNRHYDNIKSLMPAIKTNILFHLSYGLLLSASFLIDTIY